MENEQLIHTSKAFIKWQSTDGELVHYNITHQIAVLALWYVVPETRYLQVVLRGCTRIDLPTKWSGCALNITQMEQSRRFRIEDPALGILIICSEASAIPHKEKFWRDLQ